MKFEEYEVRKRSKCISILQQRHGMQMPYRLGHAESNNTPRMKQAAFNMPCKQAIMYIAGMIIRSTIGEGSQA